MTKQFQFDAPCLDRSITVEISIQCRDRDGADAEYVVESITDDAGNEYDYEKLSEATRRRLDHRAQDLADEYACYAAQEYAEGMADRAYDEMRDREMDDANE